jgi:ATP-dependent DNA ligase
LLTGPHKDSNRPLKRRNEAGRCRRFLTITSGALLPRRLVMKESFTFAVATTPGLELVDKRLAPLQIRKQPMKATRKSFPKGRWVKPVLLVDAEFRGKTADGLLRHPSFKGFRDLM